MAYHFIAIYSSYVKGCRLCWHYASEGRQDKNSLKMFIRRIEDEQPDVELSIHKLITDAITWESVVEKDPFFDDIVAIEDIKDFIQHIDKDQTFIRRVRCS